MKAKGSAGPDGWRVSELQLLLRWFPDALSEDLLHLFTHLEQHADDWPQPLQQAWVAPIPKPGQKSALNIRPIAVFGVLYRMWASCRFNSLRDWLELHLAPQQSAYRAGRGAEQEAFGFFSYLEQHQASPLFGISFDLQKGLAFDSVHHPTLQAILKAYGMPEEALQRLVSKICLRTSRRWRLQGGRLGSRFTPSRGLAQGDALSVSLFNLLLAPLAHSLAHKFPTIKLTLYADDLNLAA
eukprot:6460740-Amphidinium_carterae.1